jgi:hypothetical protein
VWELLDIAHSNQFDTLSVVIVIASEAKQSSAETPHWIASSLRSSQ